MNTLQAKPQPCVQLGRPACGHRQRQRQRTHPCTAPSGPAAAASSSRRWAAACTPPPPRRGTQPPPSPRGSPAQQRRWRWRGQGGSAAVGDSGQAGRSAMAKSWLMTRIADPGRREKPAPQRRWSKRSLGAGACRQGPTVTIRTCWSPPDVLVAAAMAACPAAEGWAVAGGLGEPWTSGEGRAKVWADPEPARQGVVNRGEMD